MSGKAVSSQTTTGAKSRRSVVKVTANLPQPVFEALQEMAESRGTSMTEVLRQAIATEKFLGDALSHGENVRLEKNGRVREVVFQR